MRKYHITAILLQLLMIGTYFLDLFKRTIDESTTYFTGFEALRIYWISVVLLSFVVLILVLHIFGTINDAIYKKVEIPLTVLSNILMVFTALLITFFSTIISFLIYGFVGLVILSVYNQHRIK
jgi:hypothetical protein